MNTTKFWRPFSVEQCKVLDAAAANIDPDGDDDEAYIVRQ